MDLIGIGLPQTESLKPQAALSILCRLWLFCNLKELGRGLLHHAWVQPCFTGS